MIEKLLLKLRARDDVSDEEAQRLREAVSETKEFPRDGIIVPADVDLTNSSILVEGFASRFKDLSDGKRQLIELHVPGDFVDLHSFPLKKLDHDVMALTPCRIALVPHANLKAITENSPHLARMLWFATMLDASIHREWILSLGQRTASARMAHLFCELHVRLGLAEMTDGLTYRLPLTQIQISEVLGLTPVHTNRMLKELRDRRLVTFKSDIVTILNLEALRKEADFDPAYLYLEKRPR